MVMTRSQTAAAAVAAVHAAATPTPGSQRHVRVVNKAWYTDDEKLVASILLGLSAQAAQAQRPRRACAKY